MTEESNSQPSAMVEGGAQTPTLRQAREAAGLQVATLAAMLKVPVERLLALEEGRYQDLPNLTFARALASSVCRALKIDPQPVLQGLPQAAEVRLGHVSQIQPATVEMRRRRALPGLPSLSPRSPLVWAALLLLLAVSLWWWLPQRESLFPLPQQGAPEGRKPELVVDQVEAESPAPAPQPGQSATVELAPSDVPAQPRAAALEPEPALKPAPVVTPAPPAAAPQLAPATSGGEAARPVQSTTGQPLLHLRARATTWIQLKDAAGKELQQRTLQPGQTLDYDGQGPVQVVLGRASGVDVIVHGQPFDTSAYASNRVARFEVK